MSMKTYTNFHKRSSLVNITQKGSYVNLFKINVHVCAIIQMKCIVNSNKLRQQSLFHKKIRELWKKVMTEVL